MLDAITSINIFVGNLSQQEFLDDLKTIYAVTRVLASLSELTSVFTTESCLVETSYLLPANRKLREKLHDLVKLLRITIVPMDSQSLDRILELQNRYADLPMDFADATLLVACETLDIRDIFTLDHKDFSIYKPNHCSRLTIHPHK